MVRAFHPIKLTEDVNVWYVHYLATAKVTMKEGHNSTDIIDALQDATNILQTALACTGTRKDHLVARAHLELKLAQEQTMPTTITAAMLGNTDP